jgi:membrane protein YdbS with pleckstrin-like domain
MPFPQKLLGEGEQVVMDLRTHPKALVVPALVLVAAAGLAGAAWAWVPEGESWTTAGRWLAVGIPLIAIVLWSVLPFLRWFTKSYTITTERLITRSGLVNRTGRDIPLGRVNDVAFQQGPIDRLWRCGSLIVSAASEQGTETLTDVPHVSQVQLRLSELVREAHGWVPAARHGVTPAATVPSAAPGDAPPESTVVDLDAVADESRPGDRPPGPRDDST